MREGKAIIIRLKQTAVSMQEGVGERGSEGRRERD